MNDLTGLVMSLSECWSVRLQLQQRLQEAMERIKELEELVAKQTEAKA